MKQLLLTFFLLYSLFGFSQTKNDVQNQMAEKLKDIERLKSSSAATTSGTVNPSSAKNLEQHGVIQVTDGKPFYGMQGKVELDSKEYADLKAKGQLEHYEVTHKEGKIVSMQKTTFNNPTPTTTTLTPCDPVTPGTTQTFPGPVDDNTYFSAHGAYINLPFNFCFYGTNYTQVNMSSNGNIQFPPTNSAVFSSVGFPAPNDKMIAPFWSDLDNRGSGSFTYDVFPTYAVFTWTNSGYFNSHSDLTNSFQMIITNGADPILPPGKNVGFYYGNMQWTTGDASGGAGGFPITQPGTPATVGANAGNGIDYFVIGRYGIPGAAYDGPGGNSDGVDWLSHKTFFFNVCPPIGGNQEPISTLVGYCDTAKVCGNDTLYIKNTFIAPEPTQTVAITAVAATLGASFTYTNISYGNSADIYMTIDGNTAPGGYHTVTMSATDNGTPVQTSVQSFVVYINQSAVNNLNGTIVLTPTIGACPGQTVSASVVVNGGVPDSYLWNNNSTTASTTYTTVIPSDSLVFVTLKSGQCKKTITGNININPVPVAAINGFLSYCNGDASSTLLVADNTYTAGNQAPYTYTWTGTGTVGTPNSQTSNVTAGNYSVTITNQYGCVSTAIAAVNVYESPSYSISTNAVSGGSVYCVTQDTARMAFHYAVSSSAACGPGNTTCVVANSINVGTGASNTSGTATTPYANLWGNTRHQYLFRATELTAAGLVAGKLSSISFSIATVTGLSNYPNFTIKLKCTAATALTTTFDNAGLTQVYQANTPITPGLNTHNFTTPYIWDGASNILVDICNDISPWTNSSAVYYNTTAFNSVTYAFSDPTPLCGTSTAGSTSTLRPNVKFGNCLAQQVPGQFNVAVTPTLGVVIPATKDSIKIDLPNINSITCYTITVTNPIGGCIKDTVICVNNNLGIVNASFAANTNSVCIGSPVVLNAGSADSYTISYIQGGVPVQLTTNSTYTHVPVQAGINTYVLTAGAYCTTSTVNYTVHVNVVPLANLVIAPMVDQTKCMDKPFVITTGANSSTPGNTGAPYTYSWVTLPGNTPAPGTNTTSSYTVNSNNTSTLVLMVSGVCAVSASDTVVVKNFANTLNVSILDSSTTCAGTPFALHALATGGYGGPSGYSYTWFVDPSTNPAGTGNVFSYVSPAVQGNYTIGVYVNDSCGYSKADYEVITVLPPCEIVIPNIITPNGDNANEMFVIKNLEHHPNTSLTIFDRWGRKVYDSPNYDNKWKADGLADGTFFYVLTLQDDSKKYNGFITVFHSK